MRLVSFRHGAVASFGIREGDRVTPIGPATDNTVLQYLPGAAGKFTGPTLPLSEVTLLPPVSTPGSYVTFRAEMDCIVAFSACPQDMLPINGKGKRPTEAHFRIF